MRQHVNPLLLWHQWPCRIRCYGRTWVVHDGPDLLACIAYVEAMDFVGAMRWEVDCAGK